MKKKKVSHKKVSHRLEEALEERVKPGLHKKVKKLAAKKKAVKSKLHKAKKALHKGKGGKVEKVLHEFKEHKLHSGSKKGPVVSNRKQAIAIALSEARKAGAKVPKKKHK